MYLGLFGPAIWLFPRRKFIPTKHLRHSGPFPVQWTWMTCLFVNWTSEYDVWPKILNLAINRHWIHFRTILIISLRKFIPTKHLRHSDPFLVQWAWMTFLFLIWTWKCDFWSKILNLAIHRQLIHFQTILIIHNSFLKKSSTMALLKSFTDGF